jgi:hypothetical protein
VQFEITEQTRAAIRDWLPEVGSGKGRYLFPSRFRSQPHLSTRQYARIVHRWVESAGLDSSAYGTHSMRRTKAAHIYKKTGHLRAVQLLLGHTNWKARSVISESKWMTHSPFPSRSSCNPVDCCGPVLGGRSPPVRSTPWAVRHSKRSLLACLNGVSTFRDPLGHARSPRPNRQRLSLFRTAAELRRCSAKGECAGCSLASRGHARRSTRR